MAEQEGDCVEVHFRLGADDYWRYYRTVRGSSAFSWFLILATVVVCSCLGAATLLASRSLGLAVLVGAVAAGVVIVLYLVLVRRAAFRSFATMRDADVERTVRLQADGVRMTTPTSDGTRAWAGIRAVTSDERLLYLIVDNHMAFVVPRRAFAAGDDERFLQTARRLWHPSEHVEEPALEG